jgi:hypothetical protein
MANAFSGLKKAKVFGNGQYLNPGFDYTLEIKQCLYNEVNAGGFAFIAECNVVETNDPNIPVGSERSFYQGKNKAFDAAMLEFMTAACGYDPMDEEKADMVAQESEGLFDIILPPTNKFKGRRLKVKTIGKPTKETKNLPKADQVIFTHHKWQPGSPPLLG